MSLLPKINTLRFRISIVYVAIIGLILFLIQGVLFFNYAHLISNGFDAQLQMRADQIGVAINTFRGMLGQEREAFTLSAQKALNLRIEYPQYAFESESPEKFWLADARKLGLDQDYLVVMDAEENVIARSGNVTANALGYFNMRHLKVEGKKFYNVNSRGGALRIIIEPYNYAYSQGYFIGVATPYGPMEHSLQKYVLFVAASTSMFLVLASLIVRLFVIRVLSSVLEISKVARNITQENLHARIRLTHADEEIRHLTGSLNEMIARLEKSFAHVKEFSLEMAHEVKTPLAIISGEAQLALKKEHTSEEYRKMFRTVFKEAKRTQRFVSDLLLLTKLDYRLIKLRFESVDLAQFLREICAEMHAIFASKGMVIQEDILEGPVFLRADKIHLRRVFFNLIDNALKFTPKGGRIDLAAKRLEQKVVITVSDTGCGISQEEISQIFHKFYRSVKGDPETDPGCGLGLSIAHSIIALHGGSITAQSELGKRTTFTIELPLI